MKPAPPRIDGAQVLRLADLETAISAGRTRHVVNGNEVTDVAALAIARYEGQPGVYLFYCDEGWNAITDTHHETIEDAVKQAEFEFEGARFVGEPL